MVSAIGCHQNLFIVKFDGYFMFFRPDGPYKKGNNALLVKALITVGINRTIHVCFKYDYSIRFVITYPRPTTIHIFP